MAFASILDHLPFAYWGILHNWYCLPLDFFFSILPVLATFWNPDFFHFPTPNFRFLATSNLCSPMYGLDKLAETCYQPIFQYCLGAVLQYLAIVYENKSPNLGWKNTKFQQNMRFFQTRKWETDANHVHMSRLMRHEYLMSSKEENHAKEETWRFWCTNAPTVGPDIKFTGAC